MKNLICILAISIAALCLTGCAALKGVSVGFNSLGYENEKYRTMVSKVDTGTTETQHFRTVVVSKTGQLPRVTGSISDVPNGKQMDIVIR